MRTVIAKLLEKLIRSVDVLSKFCAHREVLVYVPAVYFSALMQRSETVFPCGQVVVDVETGGGKFFRFETEQRSVWIIRKSAFGSELHMIVFCLQVLYFHVFLWHRLHRARDR